MAETEIATEAQPPDDAGAERLALDLSPAAVSLYTRIGRGWAHVASAPFESDGFNDFNDRLAALRERAIAFAGAPGPVALWLPDEQIWLAQAALPGPEEALPGQALAHFRQDLGRQDAELAVAVSRPGEDGTHALAATEASTWDEAREYCERWGFAPGRVSTRLAEEAFGPQGPDLQPVKHRPTPPVAAMPGRGRGLLWAVAAGAAVAALGLGALWWPSSGDRPPAVSTASPAPPSVAAKARDAAADGPPPVAGAAVPAIAPPASAPAQPVLPETRGVRAAAVPAPAQPLPARPPGAVTVLPARLSDADPPPAETALAPPARVALPAPLAERRAPAPLTTATPWVPGQISEPLTEVMTSSPRPIYGQGMVAARAPAVPPPAHGLPADAARTGRPVVLPLPGAPAPTQPMPRTMPDLEAFAERLRREFAGDLAAAGSEPHVTRRVRRLQKWSRAGLDIGYAPPRADLAPLLETAAIPDLAPPGETGPVPFGGVALELDVEQEDLRIGAWQRAPVSRRGPAEPAEAPDPAPVPTETAALPAPTETPLPDAAIPTAPVPEPAEAAPPEPAALPEPPVTPRARPGPDPAEAAPDPEPVIADVPLPRPRPAREVAAIPADPPAGAAPAPSEAPAEAAPATAPAKQAVPEIDPAEDPPSAYASLQSPKPPARPKNLARRAAATPNPALPKVNFRPASKSVRRSATQTGLPLGKASLIGVLEINSRRIALLRLPSGRFTRVGLGQVLDGWKVSAIGKTAMRLTKQGQNRTLLLVDP